ncbi:hypothetical protein Tco_1365500 [Tanacetum coccineum]
MLTGKWTPMNRDVQKFNSIYDQTKLLSGENEDDMFARVLIFFKDQTGREFTHRSAWLFLKNKFKWKNPESTQARRSRGRVTEEEEEQEMFGEDAIPRPPEAHRKAKVQHSSSSTSVTSGSQKEQYTELMQTQINLDREAKKEHSSSNPNTPSSANSITSNTNQIPTRPNIPNPFANFQAPSQNPFMNCTPEQFSTWFSQTQSSQQFQQSQKFQQSQQF